MSANDFAHWLQGFAELNDEPPTEQQWLAIKDHLALVFAKVTPQRSRDPRHQKLCAPTSDLLC